MRSLSIPRPWFPHSDLMNKFRQSRRDLLGRLITTLQALFAGALLSPLRLLARPVEKQSVDAFKALISGKVVAKTDLDYEIQRLSSAWQQIKPKQYPSLIVQANTVNEVIETVKFARANNRKISIRCSGHSYYSSFLQDDMIMLDLSLLQELSVDRDNSLAKVQPAIRAQDFLAEIAKSGFSFPAAHCGNVPLGGFLLGGGLGWNGEAWGGMSCFNIREVEVVTANGDLIRANENRNADYYWAARGAGPNFFGVVTQYTLKLYKNPEVILTTTLIWDVARAPEVADWLENKVRSMPVFIEALLILAENPDVEQRGQIDKVCIVQVSAFTDTFESARSALRPLSDTDLPSGSLQRDEYVPTPISDLYSWDATAYPRLRWDVDALWSDHEAGKLVTGLISHVKEMPSVYSSILLLMKPHTGELPNAAFSMTGNIYLACYAIWAEPEEDAKNNAWVRKTMQLLEPYTKGHYINESNYVDIPKRRVGSFSRANLDKLKELAARHDPESLFHSYIE